MSLGAPEEEHNTFSLLIDDLDDMVSELLPSLLLM